MVSLAHQPPSKAGVIIKLLKICLLYQRQINVNGFGTLNEYHYEVNDIIYSSSKPIAIYYHYYLRYQHPVCHAL